MIVVGDSPDSGTSCVPHNEEGSRDGDHPQPPGPGTPPTRQTLPDTALDRIASDPCICHGQPTVRGLRYPGAALLELLASGMTTEEIIGDHPDLGNHGVLAVLEFGALASGMRDR